jgi:hypothetical protein
LSNEKLPAVPVDSDKTVGADHWAMIVCCAEAMLPKKIGCHKPSRHLPSSGNAKDRFSIVAI